MSTTESPKESTLNPPAGSTELAKLRALIADDGFAATFQTMGRYRTALLQVASALARSSTQTADAVVTDHSVDVDKMVAQQTTEFHRHIGSSRANLGGCAAAGE
ncbi:MAG: hypothetical protein ACTHNV_17525 [Ralstonia sp.]|uniref:hypothetical protein n=1 Tax=Ralstonia sp. TaxID=54061 RepID=UPI003F7E02B3